MASSTNKGDDRCITIPSMRHAFPLYCASHIAEVGRNVVFIKLEPPQDIIVYRKIQPLKRKERPASRSIPKSLQPAWVPSCRHEVPLELRKGRLIGFICVSNNDMDICLLGYFTPFVLGRDGWVKSRKELGVSSIDGRLSHEFLQPTLLVAEYRTMRLCRCNAK